MQAQHASDIAFATTLVTNFILFTVFLVGFLVFRRIRRLRPFYVARSDVEAPGPGVLGWVQGTLAVSDEELERRRGLDFAAYLLTLKYLFWISLGYVFFGFVILVPVHATAGGGLTGISLIGLGNVPDGSGEWRPDACCALTLVFQVVWRRTLSPCFSTRFSRARRCTRCIAR